MPPHSAPASGDVIVRHDRQQDHDIFLLRTVPGDDEFQFGSRAEAVAHATKYARHQHVHLATLDSCSRTFSSMSRMSDSDA